MIEEVWTTEGPRRVRAIFVNKEDDLVDMRFSVADRVFMTYLDVPEFKSLLKAMLRFDEKITPEPVRGDYHADSWGG